MYHARTIHIGVRGRAVRHVRVETSRAGDWGIVSAVMPSHIHVTSDGRAAFPLLRFLIPLTPPTNFSRGPFDLGQRSKPAGQRPHAGSVHASAVDRSALRRCTMDRGRGAQAISNKKSISMYQRHRTTHAPTVPMKRASIDRRTRRGRRQLVRDDGVHIHACAWRVRVRW